MGCQTNDNTPKNITSPEKVEHTEEKKEVLPSLELPNAMIVQKPVLCGDGSAILKGIIEVHKERPISWFIARKQGADGQDHKVLITANIEKGTVTVLEYLSDNTACFIAVGEEFGMSTEIGKNKTTSYQKVLD